MTRLPCVAVLLACALLASSQPAAAQCNSAPPVRSPSDLGAYRDWCKSCGGTFHYNGSMSSIRCVPGPDWGRKTNTDNLTFDAYSGWYQAAYAFIRWVVGGSDPRPRPDKQQLELQRRLMMQELRRRQEAAALERREAEARFLAQVYNRLAGVLKLTEGLALQFKEIDIGGPLTLKLSDTIAQGSPSGLQPKLGDPGQVAAALRAFDPEKMTPQALADVAELVGRLPPEALQRALAQAEQDARSDAQLPAVDALQQQADVSQAAANDADAEDASAKARVGFDTPQAPGPVQMGTGTTPDLLREPGTAISPEDVPAPAAAPPPPGALLPEEKYAILKLLFPAPESGWPGARNPDEPLDNPLREEQSLKANLEGWDRWAVERAKGLPETAPDPILSVTEWSLFYKPLDRVAVAEFAPDLLTASTATGNSPTS